MQPKKKTGSERIDPDDAPPLTVEMRATAELFQGDTFIARPRGRPRIVAAKEAVNLRLDQDVLAHLRGSGPGWQTRVNTILRDFLKLDRIG